MKKITAVLLGFLLCLPLISGCGKNPVEAYFDTAEEIANLQEQQFTFSIDIESDSLSRFGSAITLIIAGNVSAINKQMTATMTLATASPKITVELTDIILDNNRLYINMKSVLSAILTLPGMENDENSADYLDELMDGNEYLFVDYADLDLQLWDYPSQNHYMLLQRPLEIINTEIRNADPPIITADGKAYSMQMNGEFIKALSFTLLNDVEENIDIYTDYILDFLDYFTNGMENLGLPENYLTLPDNLSRSELKNQLQEGIPNIMDSLDDIRHQEWEALNYYSSIEKNKDAYTYVVEASSQDNFSLNMNYIAEKASIATITPPEKAMEYSEIFERIQNIANPFDEYDDDYDDDFDDDYEYAEIDYNIVYGTTNPQVLDADVENCRYLKLYTLSSLDDETIYSIPAIIDEDAYISEHYLDTEAEDVSISYSFDYHNYDAGMIAIMEENVVNNLSVAIEFGDTNPQNSDLWLSADGSFAIMSSATDSYGEYRNCVIYIIYKTGNESSWGLEEVICIEISLWIEDLTSKSYDLLSEFSDILGIDLLDYLL